MWVKVGVRMWVRVLHTVSGEDGGPLPVVSRHLFSEKRLQTGRMDSMEVTA